MTIKGGGGLGHVVHIHVCRLPFGVSVNLHLSMVELPSAMKLVCSLLHPTYE